MSRRRIIAGAVALVVGLCVVARPAAAQPGDLAIGLKGGLNWSLLDRPGDPPGEPTLMNGAAFDGFGPVVGPSLQVTLGRLLDSPMMLEIDAMYSRHKADGSEQHPDTGARRTLTLKTDGIRFPVLAEWYLPSTDGSTYLGLGPELWLGLRSGSGTELTNTEASPQRIDTTPVTHLTFDAVVGYEIELGPGLILPMELRGVWNPFVAETTVGRFAGYENAERPGSLQVAFDWQVLAVTGLVWNGF